MRERWWMRQEDEQFAQPEAQKIITQRFQIDLSLQWNLPLANDPPQFIWCFHSLSWPVPGQWFSPSGKWCTTFTPEWQPARVVSVSETEGEGITQVSWRVTLAIEIVDPSEFKKKRTQHMKKYVREKMGRSNDKRPSWFLLLLHSSFLRPPQNPRSKKGTHHALFSHSSSAKAEVIQCTPPGNQESTTHDDQKAIKPPNEG